LDTDTGTRNLSENRAEQVYIELVKRGISSDRLTHKGYGADRKLEKEIDPNAMQRNRRVSILIIEK
jgi:outer membrane protein OmpA-like peptidoglycan-associated protein